jgi:ribosomal protein S18 acetylase RimI-like enzyme
MITFRAARPDLDDGRAFARYLDVAGEGFFRFLIGSDVERVLARAFCEPGHDLSYEHVVFAESQDTRVGMVAGFTDAEHARSSSAPLCRAAGWRVLRLAAVMLLIHPLVRFMDAMRSGDFYVLALAVDEGQRGKGVGTRLMEHARTRALQRGCKRLTLDVASTNSGARKLYERLGMVVEAESPRVWFAPRTRIVRMVRDLGDEDASST